jgi:hypothetical protein
MTAVYRMIQENWTGDQAFKEMKRYKYGADFLHSEFKKFVYAYSSQIDRLRRAPLEAAVTTKSTS